MFQCSDPRHGETTAHDCLACPDYVRRDATIATRHLLYHIYPKAGNSAWRRSVLQVLKRIDLFNGRRVVAIVTGPGLDGPGLVQEAFRGTVRDWVILPNNSRLREVVTLKPLLEAVRSEDPSQATWYGHAKGVTRPINPGATIHRWAQIQYEVCLDYWPHVERTLRTYPVAGPFKKVGYGFAGSRSAWHYSGTFFWFRNRDLFTRDWPRIDPQWWGSESYLGLHFRLEEAGCLFHEGSCPTLDLYHPGYFRGRMLPDYDRWRKEHEHERTG